MKYSFEEINKNKRIDFLSITIPLFQDFLLKNNEFESGTYGDIILASYMIPDNKSAIAAAYDYLDHIRKKYDPSYEVVRDIEWIFLYNTDPEFLSELQKNW